MAYFGNTLKLVCSTGEKICEKINCLYILKTPNLVLPYVDVLLYLETQLKPSLLLETINFQLNFQRLSRCDSSMALKARAGSGENLVLIQYMYDLKQNRSTFTFRLFLVRFV